RAILPRRQCPTCLASHALRAPAFSTVQASQCASCARIKRAPCRHHCLPGRDNRWNTGQLDQKPYSELTSASVQGFHGFLPGKNPHARTAGSVSASRLRGERWHTGRYRATNLVRQAQVFRRASAGGPYLANSVKLDRFLVTTTGKASTLATIGAAVAIALV